MNATVKRLISIVVGFVLASSIMMLVEAINGHVLYPELGNAAKALTEQGTTDPESIRALMAAAPVGALVVVLLGWLLGGIAGGWVTARIAGINGIRNALILGALLTLAGIANNLMLPPPLWFWIAGMLVLLPAAWFGGRLAGRG